MELYQWITGHRPALAAHVAFLTGSADDLPPGLLSSLGPAILRKPFDIEDLERLVTRWGGSPKTGPD